jgi:hypothetical protein
MRNGRKSRHDQAVDLDEGLIGLPEVDTRGLKSVIPVPAVPPMMQLGLDSLDPLDDPAEVLIRVSTEALEGEDDLVNEEPDELQDELDAKVADVKSIDVQVSDQHVDRLEDEAPVSFSRSAKVVAPQANVEPEAAVAAAVEVEPEAEAVEAIGETDEEEFAEEEDPDSVQLVVDLGAPDQADEFAPETEEAGVGVDGVGGAAAVEVVAREHETAAEAAVTEPEDHDIAAARIDDLAAELPAQPLPYEPAERTPLDDPALQIRLARIHLKTGSFTLARAELEALAARDQLDTPGFLNLAEARWRTGDLHGAGEAAAAYLADGGDEALCLVIAAETAAATNKPAEARRYVEQALERHLIDLDPVFAGLPRKAEWSQSMWAPEPPLVTPSVVAVPVAIAQSKAEPVATFAEPAIGQDEAAREARLAAREQSVSAREVSVSAREAVIEPEAVASAEVAEVEAGRAEAVAEIAEIEPPVGEPEPAEAEAAAEVEPEAPTSAEVAEPPGEAEVEPQAPAEPPVEVEPAVAEVAEPPAEAATNDVAASVEVASGRTYLDAGDPMMAALHFAVAIRLTPTSANAVLEAIGARQDLPLQLVRGDALRALGLEGDAGKAYLSVASALGAPKPAPAAVETVPDPEPVPVPDPEPVPVPDTEPVAEVEPSVATEPEPEPESQKKPVIRELPPIRWD